MEISGYYSFFYIFMGLVAYFVLIKASNLLSGRKDFYLRYDEIGKNCATVAKSEFERFVSEVAKLEDSKRITKGLPISIEDIKKSWNSAHFGQASEFTREDIELMLDYTFKKGEFAEFDGAVSFAEDPKTAFDALSLYEFALKTGKFEPQKTIKDMIKKGANFGQKFG